MLSFQFEIADVFSQLDGFTVGCKCQLIFASLSINAPQSSKAFAFISGVFVFLGNSERKGNASDRSLVVLEIELGPSNLTQQTPRRFILTVKLSCLMGWF